MGRRATPRTRDRTRHHLRSDGTEPPVSIRALRDVPARRVPRREAALGGLTPACSRRLAAVALSGHPSAAADAVPLASRITMEFLEINQIREWAQVHGLAGGNGFEVTLPKLPSRGRRMYAHGPGSGREGTAAAELVTGLGSWEECLVWITGWGVWPSGENWPQFYAW